MPLLTEYYNTSLQDITVNMSVSTPPMHIGPAQVLCTSYSFPLSVPDRGDRLRRHKKQYTFCHYKLVCSSDHSLLLTYNYFPNPLSKNMRFAEESRYYLCRQLVQQFDCPIDRGVVTDICVLFPGHNSKTVIIPAQVAWSF